MTRLGKTVLLAGPNGSGKSRLLRLILVITQQRRRSYHQAQSEMERTTSRLAALRSEQGSLAPGNPRRVELDQWIAASEREVQNCSLNLQCFDAIRAGNEDDVGIVSYRISQPTLASAEQLSFQEVRNRRDAMLQPGTDGANDRATAYAKQVLMEGRNASHQDEVETDETRAKVERRNVFVSLLVDLLGEKCAPKFESDGFVSLFGQKDYEGTLSDGQKVLFQLACAIHAQGGKLNESIIFLDEPENHLHPRAAIEVVDRLNALTPSGQLWIATHCVPLIAHLVDREPACLWYAERGEFVHAGRKPETVLDGLLGGAANADALREFVALPARMAINRFLAECLIPPGVVGPEVNDPQTTAIRAEILGRRSALGSGCPLRVLDYGAGKGRLLAALAASVPVETNFSEVIDYVAFDPDVTNAAECRTEIESAYGVDHGRRRHFNDLQALRGEFDVSSFDVVVLCNVLHEILPEQWTRLFGEAGLVTELMRETGGLLVVEDYAIPVGELAHREGFFLLDQFELKKLFAWREADQTNNLFLRQSSVELRYSDRLVMHWIARQMVSRVNGETRKAAIKCLRDSSSETIRASRANSNNSYSVGHRHALAAMSYTNASIWLESNGG